MLTQKQSYYLSLAIEAAKQSDMTSKHGAVVDMKQPLHGNNMYRFKKLSYMNGRRPLCLSTHAEMNALHQYKNVAKTMKGHNLYVVRIHLNKDGSLSLQDSAPCSECIRSSRICNIKRIIYTDGLSSIDNPIVKILKVSELNKNIDTYEANGHKFYSRNANINIHRRKDFQRLLVMIPD